MSHQARKRFGQNFLIDNRVIDLIIQSINPQPDQTLVEIGPGLGALTLPLLKRAGKLNVIELDRDVIPLLVKTCAGAGELIVHNVDVLQFDFNTLLDDHNKLRLIGNLPYNISTPILFKLLDHAEHIQDMFFMLQKEVVKRMAAAPDSGAYGRLSIMLQYHCKVTELFIVPPQAFNPEPKVDSAIINLQPRKPECPVSNYALLEKVVKQAFSTRRKTIRNTLKTLCSAEDLEAVGIQPGVRPENIAPIEYYKLTNYLDNKMQEQS
ncbi:MAG: 16S rRNA (adenine(1518)-N(6)/adenine(1519)-N(6))-dimethyltransferase RsmA [Gammaproteobacteria bacterium]|nr:16S rRNA (adenine(1518)-N(6)/adenine(1519)-N(6))-dimethyltransferase RsmA [Gammaproteobacteria bacterium]